MSKLLMQYTRDSSTVTIELDDCELTYVELVEYFAALSRLIGYHEDTIKSHLVLDE